jgi:hypothetical protein
MQSKDILSKDRFWNYLCTTGMYKELYSSKEGCISAFLAVATAIVLVSNAHFVSERMFTSTISSLLAIILGGGFGLLGFLVGGLGILIGSISDKMIDIIDRGKKFKALLDIVFRFYFNGAILAIFIFLGIVDYLVLMFPFSINCVAVFCLGLATSYFFWYALMLSVMLLGTSIRLMILRHELTK